MKRWLDLGKRMGMLFVGCLLLASAYNLAFDPNGLVTGGVSGLGIVIRSLTKDLWPGGIPLWFSGLLLNLPIYAVGYLSRGRKFIMSSLLGTLMMSLALFLIPTVDIVEGDRILAALFGGVCGGVGVALVIMAQASTGGTDMLGISLAKYIPGINVATLIGILDGLVVLSGVFVFGIASSLYAVVGVYLMAKVSELILTGLRNAQMVYCISGKNEEIAEEILKHLERGVSQLSIRGLYTGQDRSMLMCVVSRREIIPLKRIIRRHDPQAFVIVSSVNDVRGEGFIEDILAN